MANKIMEVFSEKESFSILELMLKLRVDKDTLEEALSVLVNQGKLRVDKMHPFSLDDLHAWKGLSSRSSIRGFHGEFYVLNE